jgi:DNA-binding CsgD family transcriptional regulator
MAKNDRAKGWDAQLLKLVTALIEGAFETPYWTSFLESLRRITAADYAFLIFDPPGRPMDEGLELVSGCEADSPITKLVRACIRPTANRRTTEEGAIVSLEKLFHPGQARNEAAFRELVDEHHIAGSRLVRVVEPRGVDGWLIIARQASDFGDEGEAVLSELVRPLSGVLRGYVAGESGRFRSMMAAEAVRRLQCGWLLLDQEGHILAADGFGEAILSSSGVLSRSAGGRLIVRPAGLDREVLRSVMELAGKPAARPRAISLRGDPWLDMLLVPARHKMISDTAVPSVIAYVHGDNWHSADRCSQLSDLFALSPSEARLALALCRGKSIAEAAAELGLALETARSYSKSIYLKTGTRGMADLVRIVMGSVLALAPDA